MRGEHAFCPRTGVPLSDDRHYPVPEEPQRGWRSPSRGVPSDPAFWAVNNRGELTNGERQSKVQGLLHYFRRSHAEAVADPDDALDRRAAVLIRSLKGARDDWDIFVWAALMERLTRAGHRVAWMHNYWVPVCPDCGSVLKYVEHAPTGWQALCAVRCQTPPGKESDDRWPEVVARTRAIYNAAVEHAAAFTDERIERVRVLDRDRSPTTERDHHDDRKRRRAPA